MSCILGTKDFIAADRRVVDNNKSSSMIKVSKNKHLIVGVCGYAALVLEVRSALRKGLKDPHDLIEILNDGFSHALILTINKELLKSQDGVLWPIGKKFETIGAGSSLMLGFLSGHGGKITHKLAKTAMKFVSKERVDCGGGCDVRYFKRNVNL